VKVVKEWASMAEFVDYVSGPSEMPDDTRASLRSGSGSTGTDTFEEATAIAFNWPEGVAQVEEMKARIALASQRTRTKVVAREAGPGVLSMGKFIAGHPQPYMSLVPDSRVRRGKGKVVRIAINSAVGGYVSTDVIMKRGAAVLALSQALEQTGHRVEIMVGDSTSGQRNSVYHFRVTVKRAEQKLNLNSVAFAVAHPAMQRRFFFSAEERGDAKFRETFRVGQSYGNPAPMVVPEGTILVPEAKSTSREWQSVEAASEWLTRTLEAQGVKVK
jgi:hypothetical protein